MELTGYLDFWFREVPIVERVERFARVGIHRLDVWLWREREGRVARAVLRGLLAVAIAASLAITLARSFHLPLPLPALGG